MLTQAVVRIRIRLYSLARSANWRVLGFLLACVLASTTGCRSTFGPNATGEPSYDRLLEIENSSALKSSPAPSKAAFAQHQVTQRRPGGNSASSRFAELEEDTEQHSQDMAAKRSISDLDEEDLNSIDAETQILRQTQLALGKSADKASGLNEQPLQATKTSTTVRKATSQSSTDEELVMRLTDKDDAKQADVEQPEYLSKESVKLEKLAGDRRPKSAADEPTIRKATTGAVQPASHESSKGLDRSAKPAFTVEEEAEQAEDTLTWQEHLRQAILQLNQSSSQQLAMPQERLRQAMIARLLSLSLNDREAMLDPIEGLQPHEQDYVNYQLSAIFDAVDPEANPVSSRKWSLVMLNQRKANTHLASLSNLEINNMAFCTEVIDFGLTTPFPSNKFLPDQEVLLYLELDNFVCEKSKDGKAYETQLQGSYEIVDSNGRRIADQMLPADSHICKNIRRDYFIAYRIYMPPKVSPGSYTLKLTIEDLKGRKFGQADIQFQIQQ